LVVEVDGPTHNRTANTDAARNAWMQHRGITVLRFTVYEIDKDLEAVVNTIIREARLRLPPEASSARQKEP
jgi:very-short-patch-repair endonuclease